MTATLAWGTVQDAIYDAVKAALPSCSVVWADAADLAPMPARPFATLNLTTREIIQGLKGSDEVQHSTTAGTQTISHHRRHVCSVNVYSASTHGATHAAVLLAALSRELRKDSRVLALRTAGCKVWPQSEIRDLTALLDTRAESRAQCDLTVATLDSTSDATGYISTVDLTHITAT